MHDRVLKAGGGRGGVPNQIVIWNCWNENIRGRNAPVNLYLKTSLWSSIYGGAIPKQPETNPQSRT